MVYQFKNSNSSLPSYILKQIILAVLVASVVCEPPVSGGYGGGGGGGGGHSGNEGQIPGAIVDQALLDRITEILNQQESQSGGGYGAPPSSSYGAPPSSSYGAPPSSSYGAPPSSSYGAPSSSYGAPGGGSGGKIQLGKVDQGILVGSFAEQGQAQGGYGGGQSSGGYGR